MNTNLVNLTPHELVIHRKDGREPLVLPRAQGRVPRVSTTKTPIDEIDGIEITRISFGWVQDMPDPQSGTTFIVWRVVADALRHRGDLLCPGELIRNEKNEVVGVKGLMDP